MRPIVTYTGGSSATGGGALRWSCRLSLEEAPAICCAPVESGAPCFTSGAGKIGARSGASLSNETRRAGTVL